MSATVQNNAFARRYDFSYLDPYFTDDGIALGYNLVYRELDCVRVKGRRAPVRIFEPLARSGELDPESPDALHLHSLRADAAVRLIDATRLSAGGCRMRSAMAIQSSP